MKWLKSVSTGNELFICMMGQSNSVDTVVYEVGPGTYDRGKSNGIWYPLFFFSSSSVMCVSEIEKTSDSGRVEKRWDSIERRVG